MHYRCTPKHMARAHYFDRGIRVCKEWFSFEQFLKDMGPKPSPTHTLDRINNDGGYSKENCRWATPREQLLNRQIPPVVVRAFGRDMRLVDFAVAVGQTTKCVTTRLFHGWTVEQVIAGHRKVRRRFMHERAAFYAEISERLKTNRHISSVAKEFGLSGAHIYGLIRKGTVTKPS